MSNLVGSHRHVTRPVDQNVGGLQQRVTEEAIGGQILLLQLVLLILVARERAPTSLSGVIIDSSRCNSACSGTRD